MIAKSFPVSSDCFGAIEFEEESFAYEGFCSAKATPSRILDPFKHRSIDAEAIKKRSRSEAILNAIQTGEFGNTVISVKV